MRKNFRSNNGPRSNNNNRGRSQGRRPGGGDHQSLARRKQHAKTQMEKYSNMARDAVNNGDRVDVEHFHQHVEHYVRTLAEIEQLEAEQAAKHQPKQEHKEESEAEAKEPAKAEDDSQEADEPAVQEKPKRAPRARKPKQAKEATDEIPLPAGMFADGEAAGA